VPRGSNLEALQDAAQNKIEEISRPLSDAEYVEYMEALSSFCDSCAEAKKEELRRGS